MRKPVDNRIGNCINVHLNKSKISDDVALIGNKKSSNNFVLFSMKICKNIN